MATANLKVGDSVNVPGSMYGTLKFLGAVDGKRGVFAGVQLAPQFATRGKNSGDVEGRHYFRTSTPGSGIFLPIDKAEKRTSTGSAGTPQTLGSFNQGGRTPKPNFSQSVGPGALAGAGGMRSTSPAMLKPPTRRESLPRPSSPLRKTNNTASTAHTPAAGRLATPRTRPSIGLAKSTMGTAGSSMKSPALRQPSTTAQTNKFGQSLRQSTRGSVTPSRMKIPSGSVSVVSSSTAAGESPYLGPESSFDEEPSPPGHGVGESADTTPTPVAGRSFKTNGIESESEIRRLKQQLEDRDRQFNDQANSLTEMERSLAELQALLPVPGMQESDSPIDEESLPRDVQDLRTVVREKNDKIKALTAEFDSNRADFRSTIDTLEMASTETERVYERRVDELLEELRGYQERNEDVESVAQQFKQLEELVQELEEGLEDARRGEAEARGEVEFLRGEVERGRSELKREKERSRASDRLNGIDVDGGLSTEELEEMQHKLEQKEDEIRGLKAIIQNLNNAAAATSPDRGGQTPRANGGRNSWYKGHGHSKTKSTNTVVSVGKNDQIAEDLQQQIRDLEDLLQQKNMHEEELQEEVSKLRQSVQFGVGNTNGGRVSGTSKYPVLSVSTGKGHRRSGSEVSKHRSGGSYSTVTAGRPGSSNRSSSSTYQGHKRKDTGVPEFVDAVQSPIREEFQNDDDHQKRSSYEDIKTPTAAKQPESISGQTDASGATQWCEICEETGHDILTCTNMFDSNSKQNSPSTSKHNSSSTLNPSGKDVVREGLRRSREAASAPLHPPPTTAMPPPPPPQNRGSSSSLTQNHHNQDRERDRDVDKPAPLSMNNSLTTKRSNTSLKVTSPTFATSLSSPREEQHPKPSTPATATTGGGTGTGTGAGPNKLIEGTGDQAGMLAGKESRVIDPDKWCALCERDGHESVDCPIEMDF